MTRTDLNVLAVDDDMINLKLLKSMLLKSGHVKEVVEAKNGSDAIGILKSRDDIDLILLDIIMPVMGGIEMLKVVRADDSLQQLPIIVLTTDETKKGEVPPVAVPVTEKKESGHFYAGAGIVYNRVYSTGSGWFDDSVLTQDQTAGLTGIIGYEYNEYIGIEGRVSSAFWERDYSDATIWSIFLKPQYRFWENDRASDAYNDAYFTLYGLIGFGNSYVEGSSGDNYYSAWPDTIGKEIMSETGFQWGIGISYTFVEVDNGERKNTWSIFVDYTMTADDASINSRLYSYDPAYYDKLSTDGLTVGVLYTF
jgi:putative two-component system response regulator